MLIALYHGQSEHMRMHSMVLCLDVILCAGYSHIAVHMGMSACVANVIQITYCSNPCYPLFWCENCLSGCLRNRFLASSLVLLCGKIATCPGLSSAFVGNNNLALDLVIIGCLFLLCRFLLQFLSFLIRLARCELGLLHDTTLRHICIALGTLLEHNLD